MASISSLFIFYSSSTVMRGSQTIRYKRVQQLFKKKFPYHQLDPQIKQFHYIDTAFSGAELLLGED
jgi:hypothetical protein